MKVILILGYLWITFVHIYGFIDLLRFNSPMGWYIFGFLMSYILLMLVYTQLWIYTRDYYEA